MLRAEPLLNGITIPVRELVDDTMLEHERSIEEPRAGHVRTSPPDPS